MSETNNTASPEKKSLLGKVVQAVKETFAPDETPYGKRKEDQVGNNLFQDTIVAPYREALKFMKENPRVLTLAQRKRKAKNRAKRKAARIARRRNRV